MAGSIANRRFARGARMACDMCMKLKYTPCLMILSIDSNGRYVLRVEYEML